jgi:hypothetical protein
VTMLTHIDTCDEATEFFGIDAGVCLHVPPYELVEVISRGHTFLVCPSLANVIEFIVDDDNDPILLLRDAVTRLAPQLWAMARDISGDEHDLSRRPELVVVPDPVAWAQERGIEIRGDVS